MTEVDSNPCAGEQRKRCYPSGQVLDSHGDVNPALIRTYQSGINRSIKYCLSKKYVGMPATEIGLCGFVSCLANEGLKHRPIPVGCAISSNQERPCRPFPRNVATLTSLCKGMKCQQARVGAKARTRLPITPSLLRQLKGVWSSSGGERDTKLT